MFARYRMAMVLVFGVSRCIAGCAPFGAARLDQDQVDYARALAVSNKRETLFNIVSLRYADAPSFITVTQIIAGHARVASVTSTGGVAAPLNNTGMLGGTLSFSNSPTFTFTPTTGPELADSYIRPLAPATVLPLAQSGVPIDLLLRIAVQSVGTLQNSAALAGSGSAGSVGFFQLTHALRRLQIAGMLSVRYESKKDSPGRVFLAIDNPPGAPDAVVADVRLVRELLHADAPEIEFIYGTAPQDGTKVAIVTRSVQGILSEVGAQIDVPQEALDSHAVMPTVKVIGVETRPVIIVHTDTSTPPNAYVDVVYGKQHYWIDSDDFDSKFAFGVVQDLIALAEIGQSGKQNIIAIPAS